MQILTLSEGTFAVNQAKVFERLGPRFDASVERAAGRTVLGIQSFVVGIGQDYTLFDTGLGLPLAGQPPLLEALRRHGLAAEHITRVVFSHLHKDHTGGLGQPQGARDYVYLFPQAAHYVQERELAFALTQTANPSYDALALAALARHPHLHYLTQDAGWLTPHLRYQVSGGHTPYHQVWWAQGDGRTAFFGGDELPQPAYLTSPAAFKTDYDGRRARAWRQQWAQQAAAEQWELLYYHALPATLPATGPR